MADSNLLKYARARDDQDFRWRIAAAMQLKAQEVAQFELTPAERALTDWVLANPMVPLERMVAAVAVNPAVAAQVTLADDRVDTSGVPDGDIIFVVSTEWPDVAQQMYAAAEQDGGKA